MKLLFGKLLHFIRNNIFFILAFIAIICIPVALLIELASGTPNIILGIRIGFITCLILGVIFIVLQSKIRRFAHKRTPRWRGIILAILLACWWGIGYGIVIGILALAHRLGDFWWHVGICWLLGVVFRQIHFERLIKGGEDGQE